MTNCKEQYDKFVELIEEKIPKTIPEKFPEVLYKAYSYVMSGGGKRIRPMLTLITAACINGSINQDIIAAATSAGVSIEVLHNFTLVHDDIMDNSPIRRGRETLHIKWSEDVAILTGDMMVGYAFSLLPTNTIRYSELVAALSSALIAVCEGQQLDMEFNSRADISLNEYIQMIELKTSALLQCSAKMGAIIGNADANTLLAVDKFAKNLGIAFQIQDDLLDMTAEQMKFGKKIGQDIIEGKKSFPILKAVELAKDQTDIDLLQTYLASKTGLSEEYVPKFRALFEKLDIFAIGQNYVNEYSKKAHIFLTECPQNEYNGILQWLVDSLSKRGY